MQNLFIPENSKQLDDSRHPDKGHKRHHESDAESRRKIAKIWEVPIAKSASGSRHDMELPSGDQYMRDREGRVSGEEDHLQPTTSQQQFLPHPSYSKDLNSTHSKSSGTSSGSSSGISSGSLAHTVNGRSTSLSMHQHVSNQITDDQKHKDSSRYSSSHKKQESSLNLPVLKSVLSSPPLSARVWSHDRTRFRHSADEYTGHSKPQAAPGRAHSADHIHDKTTADMFDSRPESRELQVTTSPSSFSSEPIMVNHRQTDFNLNGHLDNRASPASPRSPITSTNPASNHGDHQSFTSHIDSSKSETPKDVANSYTNVAARDTKPDIYKSMPECSRPSINDSLFPRQHSEVERGDADRIFSSHNTSSHDNKHSERNPYGLSKSQYESESKTSASDSIHNHDREKQANKDIDKYSKVDPGQRVNYSDKNQNYEKQSRVNFHDIKDVAGADRKEELERANVFKASQSDSVNRDRLGREMSVGGGPHLSPRDGMTFGGSHAAGYPHSLGGAPGYPGPHPGAGAGPPSAPGAPPHPAYMPFPPSAAAAAAMHPALLYQYNQYAAGLHLAQLQHLQMAQAAQAAHMAQAAHAQQQLHTRGQHLMHDGKAHHG